MNFQIFFNLINNKIFLELISPGLSVDKGREDQDQDLDNQNISSHHLDLLFKVILQRLTKYFSFLDKLLFFYQAFLKI